MLWCSLALLALCASVQGRAVNISNTWVLPEEGFPVFYRYFRDRISWYEADAVCQFHHANLVTVDTTAQYDAVRAYLKELDISSAVWVGLIRSNPDGDFTWTDYRGLSGDGYWSSAPDARTAPLCAAADPAADYRWEARPCGGPTVASFICELPVPQWALGNEGCMVRALPALTILYLPESAAVQLTADCGLAGVKRVQCTGNVKREDLLKELSCTDENESSSPSVSSTSDTAFTDQDTTNDVTTEENITIDREDNINQSNTIQPTPIPYKFNAAVEYKLPTIDKIKLNKVNLEKNFYLDDMHYNNLQSNDIPRISNSETYITSEQLDKIEDEKHMQHKMLHDAFARLDNIENIFTQPTDHFVPPLVMAKAKISDDMTVLSLKEKHAQQIAEHQLSRYNSQHEHMHIDKSTTKNPAITDEHVTDIPLVMPITTSQLNDYEKKEKMKTVLPKKYNEKYYDIKNKVLKIFDNKSFKTAKSTDTIPMQSKATVKDIETTTVKLLQQDFNKNTSEADPFIELTVTIKDDTTEIKNNTVITNYTGDVPKLETILNGTEKLPENFTMTSNLESSSKNIYDNTSNFTLNNEVIKITIIPDNNSTVHPTVLEITTKIPVSTESSNDDNKINLVSTTTQVIEKADSVSVTKMPKLESTSHLSTELERNDTNTTPIPTTSVDYISTRSTDIKTTITLHTTTSYDKKITAETIPASATTTQISMSNNDKTNTSESALITIIPDSTINLLNTESKDEFDMNYTNSSGIDDFQSPLLSAASEPLHRPNRSRRPQQPQNRIKFNPFRILG